MDRMSLNQNPVVSAATAIGIAGGGVLLAPVVAPALQGLAGIAVVGFGVYATGSAVISTSRFLNEKATGLLGDGAKMVELLKGSLMSRPKEKVPAREIPFRRQ